MRDIRNWYKLLEGNGLVADDSGPGAAQGSLTANVTWAPYYFPPGTPYDHKGVVIAASASQIVSGAALGFPASAGSIEMLVKPSWSFNDGATHFLWHTFSGNNRRFQLQKYFDGYTYLMTDGTSRGSFQYAWAAGIFYHVVLNWGTNELWINGTLVNTYTAGGLGNGSSTLYIGDHSSLANAAFSGPIYYFIARLVALTPASPATFKAFFENQYVSS